MKRMVSPLALLLPLILLFWGKEKTEGFLFLGAVLLHEAGHLALLFFATKGVGVKFTPFGVSLIPASPWIPYKKEILISLSGPVANLLACLVLLIFIRRKMTFLLLYFFFCNLLLAFINLIPARGLDGYFALKSALSIKGDEEEAERILKRVDAFFSLLLFLGGTLLFLKTGNASLILLSLFLTGEKGTKKATTTS